MKLDVLCNDGSPLGVQLLDIYGENNRLGVGGAELALLTLCEGWHNSGHDVRLYNNPINENGRTFEQLPVDRYDPYENRDVVVVFRSPNPRVDGSKGLKVWWSCDQFTVGDYGEFQNHVDKIVTISPFHAKYFKDRYEILNTITIDLPVRTWDYRERIEKVPHSLIFCSVPDRGLQILLPMLERIEKDVPDVSLTITSDYRLWGAPSALNEQFVSKCLGKSNIKFLGAVPRREMVQEQLKAEIQAYPCVYDELFCYSVAECSVAGAYPITPPIGALETTNMGTVIDGTPFDRNWQEKFVDSVVERLLDPDLSHKQTELRKKAMKRFSIDRILQEWEERVFSG